MKGDAISLETIRRIVTSSVLPWWKIIITSVSQTAWPREKKSSKRVSEQDFWKLKTFCLTTVSGSRHIKRRLSPTWQDARLASKQLNKTPSVFCRDASSGIITSTVHHTSAIIFTSSLVWIEIQSAYELSLRHPKSVCFLDAHGRGDSAGSLTEATCLITGPSSIYYQAIQL